MSIYAISWVLQHSEATGTDRLVLIALADYARDDGGGAFPSVENIGKKARTKKRATQYALRALEENGHIVKSGMTPKGTTVYRIVMEGGANSAPPGGAPDGQGGAPDGQLGVHGAAPNPSGDPSKDPSEQLPVSLDPATAFTAAVEEIFEAWRTGTGRNGASKLDPARRKKVTKRLEEAMAGVGDQFDGPTRLRVGKQEILEAVSGMVSSVWHRENGHQEFSQLFRDRGCIEKFVTRHRKHRAEVGTGAAERYAEYDKKVDEENGGNGGS